YWDDFSELSSLMIVNNWVYSASAIVSVTLAYLFLKSRIINKLIEIRGRRIKTGVLLFTSSVILYLAGSYSAGKPVFHALSVVFLAYSYLVIRMNTLAARILSPVLLTIVALSLLTVSNLLSGFIPALFFSMLAVSPLLFSRRSVYLKLLVTMGHMLLYFILRAVPFTDLTLLLSAFSEALVLLLFIRRSLPVSPSNFEAQMDEGSCPLCGKSENTGDFCFFCGRMLVQRLARSRLEVLEATLFIVFIVLSQLISIPILVKGGEGVAINHLKIQGPVGQALSFHSSEWLLYDRQSIEGYDQESPESLMIREILVPENLPETKNYTVVFEMTLLNPRIANGWRFRPWKVRATQSVLLKDSIPATYYEVTSEQALLKVVVWTKSLNVFVDGRLVARTIGISIMRNYTLTVLSRNETYASDMSTIEFLQDAGQISFETIRMLELASGWSQIVYSAETLLSSASSVLPIALIIVSVVGTSILVASKSREVETHLLELLPKDWLRVLLTLDRLTKTRVPTTGENLLREIRARYLGEVFDADRLLQTLDDLEALKLVKRRIKVGLKTVFLEWRLNF
ncbi:MAG: hypothetical protein FGF50_09595, partial [Candidatus Brockarchaeota archaeon]|nr:hypothetical protein [Candidatus Brockarchaeota archaeon]